MLGWELYYKDCIIFGRAGPHAYTAQTVQSCASLFLKLDDGGQASMQPATWAQGLQRDLSQGSAGWGGDGPIT
jgi:hypothetical protein